MTEKPHEPNGVVALLIGSDGHVWATAADFERSGYGGFKLHEAQRIRARRALRAEFVCRVMNSALAAALDTYTIEKMVEDICQKLGHREVFYLLGHEGVEVYRGDYLNREASR